MIHQISSSSISPPPSNCFADVDTCMSNLCKWSQEAFYGNICEVQNGAESCLDQMKVCVNDAVCNKYLIPVIQACMAPQCDHDRCEKAYQQFYSSMPHNVAEMIVIYLLNNFRVKCWSPEEAQCSDRDLQNDECISQMDPALILGADSECKMAFLDTLGTALHYPCQCKGMHNDDLLTCNLIHDVLHNRSHFMTSWKSSDGPTKYPEVDESEQAHTWSNGSLLFAFATAVLVGVVVLVPLAVVSKIWMLRRRDKTKSHHPEKSNCAVNP
ncbi:GDNF family receptor alpha-like [Dissostichus eleginoides]|uniref:GDNF family receptor alpha-like n=1 Tax=Dissostichus eleginoides TaxID=100907 RepID=A0AAD9FJN6_DISEL|nr:GDNF family receptor alpha-like [Dissostichus eleginoides]